MKTSNVLADMQHALGVGGAGPDGDHDHQDGPSYQPSPTHELGEGEDACQGCGMRLAWPGIADDCRAKSRARTGIPLGDVPSIFALVWKDFSLWWEERAHERHAPTVDEWLHQMMEFRKAYRRAPEDD